MREFTQPSRCRYVCSSQTLPLFVNGNWQVTFYRSTVVSSFRLLHFVLHFIWINFPRRLEAVQNLVPQPLDTLHPEAVSVVPADEYLVDEMRCNFRSDIF